MGAFSFEDVEIDIEAVDRDVALVTIDTPVGRGEMLGQVRIIGSVLYIDKAHVDGVEPGRLGRAGVNAILRRLMVGADVERIVIQGETRSTGNIGRRPKPVVFPRRDQDRPDI